MELGNVKKILEVKEVTIIKYDHKEKLMQSEIGKLKSELQSKAEQLITKNKNLESLKGHHLHNHPLRYKYLLFSESKTQILY